MSSAAPATSAVTGRPVGVDGVHVLRGLSWPRRRRTGGRRSGMNGTKQRDALVEQYMDGGLSRRAFVTGALKLGLSMSAAAALLAACGKSSSNKSAPTTVPRKLSGKVQVLVGFGTGNSPAQVTVQETLAQAFTRTNPDVTIEFVRVPTGSGDARTKLTTLIAGGAAPQLVMPAGLYGISLF